MAARNILRIENGALIVVPRGLDRIWGFRSRVIVPLTSIVEVRIERSPHRAPRGWRGPGLDVFWKLSGTFHPNGERHYWNYSGSGEALSIRLDGSQHFDQLLLSVDDAEAARCALADAVASMGAE